MSLRSARRASFQLSSIATVRGALIMEVAKSLIHGLITSRLDFCNSLLAGLPEVTLRPLQAVQIVAARLLTDARKHCLMIHLI